MSHHQQHHTEGRPKHTLDDEKVCANILTKQNYYEILGVAKTSTEEDIKKSYRKLALKLHPDKNPAPKATEAFKKINTAFATLSDKDQRSKYDRFGSDEDRNRFNSTQRTQTHGANNFYFKSHDANDIFNSFFQQFSQEPRRQQQQQRPQQNTSFRSSSNFFNMHDDDDLSDLFFGHKKQTQQKTRIFKGPDGRTYIFKGTDPDPSPNKNSQKPSQTHTNQSQSKQSTQYSSFSQQKQDEIFRNERDKQRQKEYEFQEKRKQQETADKLNKQIKDNLYKLLWFVGIFFLMWVILVQSSAGPDFKYSMTLSREFPHEVTTARLQAKYYINDDTLTKIKKQSKQFNVFEQQLENKIYKNTQNDCEKVKKLRNKKIIQANNNPEKRQMFEQEAMDIPMDKCLLFNEYQKRRYQS
eukprot:403345022